MLSELQQLRHLTCRAILRAEPFLMTTCMALPHLAAAAVAAATAAAAAAAAAAAEANSLGGNALARTMHSAQELRQARKRALLITYTGQVDDDSYQLVIFLKLF